MVLDADIKHEMYPQIVEWCLWVYVGRRQLFIVRVFF